MPEGNTKRTSGFFSWQAAYSEWHFDPTLWPDFTDDNFQNAITVFDASERGFGK